MTEIPLERAHEMVREMMTEENRESREVGEPPQYDDGDMIYASRVIGLFARRGNIAFVSRDETPALKISRSRGGTEAQILEALGKGSKSGLTSPQIHSVVPGSWEEITAELERMVEEKLLITSFDVPDGQQGYMTYKLNHVVLDNREEL